MEIISFPLCEQFYRSDKRPYSITFRCRYYFDVVVFLSISMFILVLPFLPSCLTANCGKLKPEIVPASRVDEPDLYPVHNVLTQRMENFWLAELGKTSGQGFIMKLGSCKQTIAGIRIQNTNGPNMGTKNFRISGRLSETDPWGDTLLQEEIGSKNPAPILTFYFRRPVTLQFLRFELLEFFGIGGGLQYFSPVGKEKTVLNLKYVVFPPRFLLGVQSAKGALAGAEHPVDHPAHSWQAVEAHLWTDLEKYKS